MVVVDPSNDGAAQGWDGPTGDFWTDNVDLFDAGVARYLPPFLAAAAIEPGAQVLDVGCGGPSGRAWASSGSSRPTRRSPTSAGTTGSSAGPR